MEFIDRNGDEVLSLPSFSILPKHVVQLIISRESLAVSEVSYNFSNILNQAMTFFIFVADKNSYHL